MVGLWVHKFISTLWITSRLKKWLCIVSGHRKGKFTVMVIYSKIWMIICYSTINIKIVSIQEPTKLSRKRLPFCTSASFANDPSDYKQNNIPNENSDMFNLVSGAIDKKSTNCALSATVKCDKRKAIQQQYIYHVLISITPSTRLHMSEFSFCI